LKPQILAVPQSVSVVQLPLPPLLLPAPLLLVLPPLLPLLLLLPPPLPPLLLVPGPPSGVSMVVMPPEQPATIPVAQTARTTPIRDCMCRIPYLPLPAPSHGTAQSVPMQEPRETRTSRGRLRRAKVRRPDP
jgi:hypothetical protein